MTFAKKIVKLRIPILILSILLLIPSFIGFLKTKVNYDMLTYLPEDMDTVVGEVVQNPNNPNLWGIKNKSKDNWTYIRADGQQVPVAVERSAAIAKDAKIGCRYPGTRFGTWSKSILPYYRSGHSPNQ